MKNILLYCLILFSFVITSCSKRDYTNVVPSNSTAVIVVNAMDFVSNKSPFATYFAPFLNDDQKELKGIDLTKSFYLFETVDGFFGLCAPMADAYEFGNFLKRMQGIGGVKQFVEKGDETFCIVGKTCVIGYNDDVMLAMGPVTGSDEQRKMMRRMANMMNQDESEGIKNSTLWKHLEEIKTPVKMIAQANALPEQMTAMMMIGAPKGTSSSDVLIEADLKYEDNTLYLNGNACSYLPNVKQSIQKSSSCYKPLTINWQKMMNDSTLIGLFTNVNGEDFMPYIQQNKTLNAMLLCTSAYDRIRKNKGNIAMLLSVKDVVSLEMSEESVSYKILNLPSGNEHTDERFVVAINLLALKGPIATAISPFLGNIKRIVYTIK